MCLKLLKTFYIICNWLPFLQQANYASHSKIIRCVYWVEVVWHYDSHLMNTGKDCAKTMAVAFKGFSHFLCVSQFALSAFSWHLFPFDSCFN